MKQSLHLPTTPVLCVALLAGAAVHVGAAQDSAAVTQRPWAVERAWSWYQQRPWIAGFNYVPSTAANTTEFWAAGTFDPKTIDRELGWGAGLGFNSCRVFVQFLVWKNDSAGLKRRLDQFLALASRHGLTTTSKVIDWSASDYTQLQTKPGLPAHTEDGIK